MLVHSHNGAAVGHEAGFAEFLAHPLVHGEFIHPRCQAAANHAERLGAHPVHSPAGFEVSGKLLRIQAGFKFLNQLGGTGDLRSKTAHQLAGSGVHHRHVRNRAQSRILHCYPFCALEYSGQLRVLFLPTGVEKFLTRHAVENVGLNAMHQSTGLPMRGNQIVPAARYVFFRLKSQYAVGQRVAEMVIEKQPAIKILALQCFLDSCKVHANRG